MKISILQPKIERGNIQKNISIIQELVNNATGDLLVLAEYALTGSLVLDENADTQEWAVKCDKAMRELSIPKGKSLLLNSLTIKSENIYNACILLPDNKIMQIKNNPDNTEISAGIHAGDDISTFQFDGKRIKILICSDIINMDKISTLETDFILFIYHFTPENYGKHIANLIGISKERNLPIITASLTSDKNYGHSCYVYGSTVVALGNHEGIMEVTI